MWDRSLFSCSTNDSTSLITQTKNSGKKKEGKKKQEKSGIPVYVVGPTLDQYRMNLPVKMPANYLGDRKVLLPPTRTTPGPRYNRFHGRMCDREFHCDSLGHPHVVNK
ncbi:hypothetical protein CDAR_501731 [Caerostris darwini]|uniref:Uncharacterized protein n=1 Tax=Caerostris darwini TaxID=1538125 RepID=A0AAV4TMI8_9ARAC|nr:hypothetical protein CDAR_501731 [Caerostris darwini]